MSALSRLWKMIADWMIQSDLSDKSILTDADCHLGRIGMALPENIQPAKCIHGKQFGKEDCFECRKMMHDLLSVQPGNPRKG